MKANFILIFSTNTNWETLAYRYFRFLYFEARGVREVTIGITGLWQPSVHSDATFLFFDVGSYYNFFTEVAKFRIVHPLIGNVIWVWTVVGQVRFTLLMYLVPRQ